MVTESFIVYERICLNSWQAYLICFHVALLLLPFSVIPFLSLQCIRHHRGRTLTSSPTLIIVQCSIVLIPVLFLLLLLVLILRRFLFPPHWLSLLICATDVGNLSSTKLLKALWLMNAYTLRTKFSSAYGALCKCWRLSPTCTTTLCGVVVHDMNVLSLI